MDNEKEILDNVADGFGAELGPDSVNMKGPVPDKNKR